MTFLPQNKQCYKVPLVQLLCLQSAASVDSLIFASLLLSLSLLVS